MTRLMRLATAVLLALAVTAVPIVADWCAARCEATHEASSEAAPACHHSSSSLSQIGVIPPPCSHNHHPIVVDAGTLIAAALRTMVTAATAATSSRSSLSAATALSGAFSSDAAPPTQLPLALASILRV